MAYNVSDILLTMLQLQEAGVLLSEEELWYVLSEMAQVSKAVHGCFSAAVIHDLHLLRQQHCRQMLKAFLYSKAGNPSNVLIGRPGKLMSSIHVLSLVG